MIEFRDYVPEEYKGEGGTSDSSDGGYRENSDSVEGVLEKIGKLANKELPDRPETDLKGKEDSQGLAKESTEVIDKFSDEAKVRLEDLRTRFSELELKALPPLRKQIDIIRTDLNKMESVLKKEYPMISDLRVRQDLEQQIDATLTGYEKALDEVDKMFSNKPETNTQEVKINPVAQREIEQITDRLEKFGDLAKSRIESLRTRLASLETNVGGRRGELLAVRTGRIEAILRKVDTVLKNEYPKIANLKEKSDSRDAIDSLLSRCEASMDEFEKMR